MCKVRIIKTSVETVVIPAESREYFLTQPSPDVHCMDDYKIMLAGVSQLTPGYFVERTPSYFNLILYCHRGSALVKGTNQTMEIRPGEVMMIPTGSTYSYKPLGSRWDIVWAHLDNSPEWNSRLGTTLVIRKAQWGAQVKKIMESYIEEANTRRPDSPHALKLCIELLAFYLKRELRPDTPEVIEALARLQALWGSVHENLQHKWTVEEMASSAGLCKTHLHRLCLKLHKTTPMNMVTAMRMEQAAEMLSFTNYTLTMIADGIGYENAFAFSKAFKRYAGISPKEYRSKQDLLKNHII
ncbi:MAG: AraC family transcriptional regulator [Kiritimatiellales bacterium]|jgi:AraC-like DNA-binding protein